MGVKTISPWNAKRARTEAEGRVRAGSMGVKTILDLDLVGSTCAA
jgi:hypothetical protein